ncbi:MAG TPA: ATP-binding protein [Candidatus Dormibacteraeota bacterium]|jgi:signal transduction histidine kinase
MMFFSEVADAYERDLRAYIADPTEEGLAAAYQDGRNALAGGIGLVAFAEMHSRVFAKVGHRDFDTPFAPNLAASFFAEAMAPYEMALRGYRDSNSALKHANEQLERANLMKTRFFNYLNHELRTPLNSVLGFAELMAMEKAGPLSTQQARYCGNIESSGRHMLRLVNEMLDLAKLEAGKMEVAQESLDLKEVIVLALEQSSPLAIKSGVELLFSPIDDMQVIGDRQRLLQVFLNLLSNALKFTPSGGRVEIGATSSAGDLTVRVVDSGIGIADDQLEVIFDEFAQAAMTEAAAPLGTGLGLPLTRRLLQLMRGTIVAESATGAGSTFVMTIPRVRMAVEQGVRSAIA